MNPPAMEKVLLVIPAFRESARLPRFLATLLAALADAPWTTEIKIVDDGSGVEECRRLRHAIGAFSSRGVSGRPALGLERLPGNRGKGAAIRHGWAFPGEATILGFVDADGSVPAGEIVRAVEWMLAQRTRPALFASRVKMLGRDVRRRAFRHYAGRIFATLASEGLSLPVYDSQCGLKLLPRAAYEAIRADLREDGFCLDLEMLVELARRAVPLAEFPIDWHDEPGSKVRLLRDGWRMIGAVRRLRARQRGFGPAKKVAGDSKPAPFGFTAPDGARRRAALP